MPPCQATRGRQHQREDEKPQSPVTAVDDQTSVWMRPICPSHMSQAKATDGHRLNPNTAGFRMTRVASVDSALLAEKLLKEGSLKVYPELPHGMCTTRPEIINPDLLDFVRA